MIQYYYSCFYFDRCYCGCYIYLGIYDYYETCNRNKVHGSRSCRGPYDPYETYGPHKVCDSMALMMFMIVIALYDCCYPCNYYNANMDSLKQMALCKRSCVNRFMELHCI